MKFRLTVFFLSVLTAVLPSLAADEVSYTFNFKTCNYGQESNNYIKSCAFDNSNIYDDNSELIKPAIKIKIESEFDFKFNTLGMGIPNNDKVSLTDNSYDLYFTAADGYLIKSISVKPDTYVEYIWESNGNKFSSNSAFGRDFKTDPQKSEKLTVFPLYNTNRIEHIIVKYVVDPDYVPEVKEAAEFRWSVEAENVAEYIPGVRVTDGGVEGEFPFSIGDDGNVNRLNLPLILTALDGDGNEIGDYSFENVKVSLADDKGNATLSVADDPNNEVAVSPNGKYLLSIAKPGTITLKAELVTDNAEQEAVSASFSADLAKVAVGYKDFSNTPSLTLFDDIFTRYNREAQTHPLSEYVVMSDEEGYPLMRNDLAEIFVAAMEPADWDTSRYITSLPTADLEDTEDNHYNNHHHFYLDPVVEIDSEKLAFGVSQAGVYNLSLRVKDEYQDYFSEESLTEEYRYTIRPNLEDERIIIVNIGKEGKWNVVAAKDEAGKWGIVTDEELLKESKLGAHYLGNLYVDIHYPAADPDAAGTLTHRPLNTISEKSEFNIPDNYEFYNEGKGVDLRNATGISMIEVSNGAVSEPKHITFEGSDPTGVDLIFDENQMEDEKEAEYYTLDGRRAQQPLAPGLYIRRQGRRGGTVIIIHNS